MNHEKCSRTVATKRDGRKLSKIVKNMKRETLKEINKYRAQKVSDRTLEIN